jgi:Flp pilus assembly protein TadG
MRAVTRSPDRHGADRGSVTVWMTFGTIVVLLVVGLVYDGGLMIGAKRKAIDDAEQAARAGAQAVDPNSPTSDLDPAQAERLARQFMDRNGWTGEVTAAPRHVDVKITRVQHLAFLTMVGLSDRTVTGTASAEPETGRGP